MALIHHNFRSLSIILAFLSILGPPLSNPSVLGLKSTKEGRKDVSFGATRDLNFNILYGSPMVHEAANNKKLRMLRMARQKFYSHHRQKFSQNLKRHSKRSNWVTEQQQHQQEGLLVHPNSSTAVQHFTTIVEERTPQSSIAMSMDSIEWPRETVDSTSSSLLGEHVRAAMATTDYGSAQSTDNRNLTVAREIDAYLSEETSSNSSAPETFPNETYRGTFTNRTCQFEPIFDMSNYSYEYRTSTWKDITYSEVIKIVLYVIVFIVAVAGNLLVILVVYYNTNLWSSTNRYLVNLAVADLLVALCCLTVHLVKDLSSPIYVLPAIVCRMDSFIQATSLSASVLTLTAISVGRFVAVMFPLRAHTSPDRAYHVIAAIWCSSALLASPMLVYRQLYSTQWADFTLWQCDEFWPMEGDYNDALGMCVVTSNHKKHFYIFFTIAIYFVPVTVMILSYGMVVWRLWASKLPGEQSHESRMTVSRSKRKVVKMVTAVVVVFVICWTPLQGVILYSYFNENILDDSEGSMFHDIQFASYFIAYTNSAINPIIYCSFNSSLRKGLLALLQCQLQKRNAFHQRRTNWKGMTAGTRETTFGVSGLEQPGMIVHNSSTRRGNNRIMVRHDSQRPGQIHPHLQQQFKGSSGADHLIGGGVYRDSGNNIKNMPSLMSKRCQLERNSSGFSVLSSGSVAGNCGCCGSCGPKNNDRKRRSPSMDTYSRTNNVVMPDIAKIGDHDCCPNLYLLHGNENGCKGKNLNSFKDAESLPFVDEDSNDDGFEQFPKVIDSEKHSTSHENDTILQSLLSNNLEKLNETYSQFQTPDEQIIDGKTRCSSNDKDSLNPMY